MKSNLIYIAILMVFASCQKPIDLKLKSTDVKTVIEAKYSPNSQGIQVLVSKSASYFGTDSIKGLANADIILTFDDTIVHLNNNQNMVSGLYSYPLLKKYLYKSYKIEVTVEGKTYTATSTMPKTVPIDSVSVKQAEGLFARAGGTSTDSSTSFTVSVYFKDPIGINYYKIILYKNHVRMTDDPQSEEQIFDDSYYKSNTTISVPLIIKCFGKETITAELLSIDKPAYDFYMSLQTTMTSAGGTFSVPENPYSNFNNDALGFFSAYGSDTSSAIVPLPKKK